MTTNINFKYESCDLAAKSGDLETIKKAFGEAGKSCKACHDNYRKK